MVDNSSSSTAQMEGSLGGGGYPQGGPAGVKLEAVMEQLQRQRQARLEMERKERHLREAHLMYAQQVAAQQAILAAARASGLGLTAKAQGPSGGLVPGALEPSHNQSATDSEREDDRGRGSDDDGDDEEDDIMEGDDVSEEDEDGPVSGLEFLRKQTMALQEGTASLQGRPFTSFAGVTARGDGTGAQREPSPPVRVKQEPEDLLSPVGPPSAISPNGQGDWSSEEHFKQNGSSAWGEESDGGRGRGEASRDFAKLYELDSDPNRKEFLDDLFTFMQKRDTLCSSVSSECSVCPSDRRGQSERPLCKRSDRLSTY